MSFWVNGLSITLEQDQTTHKMQKFTFVARGALTYITRRLVMPRKGEMSEQDAADELVRQNAAYYNVVLYVPQRNSRVHFSSENIDDAVEFAETVYDDKNLPRVRSAMIYAVQEDGRFAMVGSTNRFDRKYKPVKVKIY